MKSQKLYLICVFLFIIVSASGYAQSAATYDQNIATAKQLFNDKEYITAAKSDSNAFLLNGNRGRVDHRYDAARSWALGGQPDSAFYELNKVVKFNYIEYLRLVTDTAFIGLRNDTRWPGTATAYKVSKKKQDSLNNAPFKNLNLNLVAELDSIYNDDQLVRYQADEVQQKYGRNSPQMIAHIELENKMDAVNTIKISKILDQYGWLGKEDVGVQGNQTLFLVIQHADLNIQLRYLPMMRKAVAEGKAQGARLELLEDRTARGQGKKQIYGSQLRLNNATGKYFVQPMIDPENVDKRRASVGLGPIAEYVSQWGITWSIDQYEDDLVSANTI
jgi:hypothetical protein